jgi:hypothetical protein
MRRCMQPLTEALLVVTALLLPLSAVAASTCTPFSGMVPRPHPLPNVTSIVPPPLGMAAPPSEHVVLAGPHTRATRDRAEVGGHLMPPDASASHPAGGLVVFPSVF